jgi:hypothetical protein
MKGVPGQVLLCHLPLELDAGGPVEEDYQDH